MNRREFSAIGETLYSDTLPNGLRLHVVTKPGYAKSYAFFATNYGGADRRFKLAGEWNDTPAGVAHFLEHKMFDTPDGGNALSVLSANGASPNAFTSSGMTAYYFESTEGFYENLETLLSFVSVPYFTPESVQKEQGIIGQEIRMTEDNPFFVCYYGLLKCLFEHNPIRDSVAGTVESIAQITDQTLYGCHKVFYNPSNMALCVVGDVDPEKVLETALRILPAEAGERPARDYGETEQDVPHEKRFDAVMEVSMPLFAFGWRYAPAEKGEAALRQRLTASLALCCLLGSSSPLYSKLYADGLINGSFDCEADYSSGAAMLIVSGESMNPDAVIDAVCDEVQKVLRCGLDADLFERVKRSDYGARLRGLGQFAGLARNLAEGAFEDYCPLDALSVMETIGVEDAEQFIRETMPREKLAISVVRPRA